MKRIVTIAVSFILILTSSIATNAHKYEGDNYLTNSIIPTEQNKSTVKPTHVKKDIIQKVPISYNSELSLESTVFSESGTDGTFTYKDIREHNLQWPSNYNGYHFSLDSIFHSLNNNRKKCTVTLKGHPQNAYGTSLLRHLTETVTFSPN